MWRLEDTGLMRTQSPRVCAVWMWEQSEGKVMWSEWPNYPLLLPLDFIEYRLPRISRFAHLRTMKIDERIQSFQRPWFFWVLSVVLRAYSSLWLKLSVRWYFVFLLELPCCRVPVDGSQLSVRRGTSAFHHQCHGRRKTVFSYRITGRIL